MKTLLVNISLEHINADDGLVILPCDLWTDLYYVVGEYIAGGIDVNKIDLLVGFEEENDFGVIKDQLDELLVDLLNEKIQGTYVLDLPESYLLWLKYNSDENLRCIYKHKFLHKPNQVELSLADLFQDIIESATQRILRQLRYNDLYKGIDKISFSDERILSDSPMIRAILNNFGNINFVEYSELKKASPSDGLSVIAGKIAQLIADDFYEGVSRTRNMNLRKDDSISSIVKKESEIAADYFIANDFDLSYRISVPYIKNDSLGNIVIKTNIEHTIWGYELHRILYPELYEKIGEGIIIRSVGDSYIKRNEFLKYAVVTGFGRIIIPYEYDEIIQLSSGVLRLRKGNKYGFFNHKIIPSEYDEVFDFKDAYAIVKVGDKQYKIDTDGNIRFIKLQNEWQTY